MLVVDSSVWIDFFRGVRSAACDHLAQLLNQPDDNVLVPDLVLFEVLRGFRDEREIRVARQAFDALHIEAVGGHARALRAAERWKQLRDCGWTVRSSVDALVASFCIDQELVLMHRDRDFDAYSPLGLRSWSQSDTMN